MSNLVIVESPAKARTIGNYLGKDYLVKATMGHVRDLPKSGKAIDIQAGFVLNYQPIDGKEKVIAELRKAASECDQVLLATDPDREGEAISWHLKELLELSDEKALRVTFNEITQKEVLKSINSPRQIDYPLVDAQQARRALDRIVGYEISPILWKKIRRGLSAGRVQSVATRLVVDREKEIRAFKAEEYWTIEVGLNRVQGVGRFKANYFAPVGSKKVEIKDEKQVNEIINAVKNSAFSVKSVTHSDKKRSPSPPFTTSTLQQEASRRLGMTPKRAMAVAQQLYEGIQVEDHGMTGLITYMRTDSLRLSESVVEEARIYIGNVYGAKFVPKSARVYKSKANAQDAHEAIRPSYVELPPDKVKASLTPEQFKLYKLIWDRFLSCQMENALFDLLTIDSVSANHVFRANHTSVKFAGFTAVYVEAKDDETDDTGISLPDLSEGEALSLIDTKPEQHFTKPPARFTQAALIHAMEEKGIGRPSTYAPTISTIVDREYVLAEGKQLRPTPLGEAVTEYMLEKFNNIVDVQFTANMENSLDEVEEGRKEWKTMLGEFYQGFSDAVKLADSDQNRVKIADEETTSICEVCGKPIVIKMGRFGRYMACTGYPEECKYTRPISEDTVGLCPLCDSKILKKKSKRGFAYFGCEKNPGCAFMTWDTPCADICPGCGKTTFKNRTLKEPFCQNPECSSFIPDDQRGYRKKKESSEGEQSDTTKKSTAKKPAAKKSAAKKTTKKPAAKKTAAAKQTPASKTETTVKKPAAQKPTVKKAAKIDVESTQTVKKAVKKTDKSSETKTVKKTTKKVKDEV